ncbi:hypothetical protein [Sabulicella rubraurantiaca]|uniref:hypothetical protein n=1 Tax=Sabulicella rubraurantiaca TaxID=2811429 RepID=UPI001A96550A|nr:hypothetical protein [Sabulicella rubraurantiaca]
MGKLLTERAFERSSASPFSYRHYGKLATIGRHSAVVYLDCFKLRDHIGWCFWGIAQALFLIGFRSRVVVSFEWLWSYLTLQRSARLITGRRRDD